MPRNDDNYIYPGQEYELLYFDVDGWKSHKRIIADDYHITFENVPSNAVYWLRNHSKGEEERIFIYQNNSIEFL